jgi:hypothetical protein
MRLRFCDLVAQGIVRNRATLSNWQKKYDFPAGHPNSRTWDEETEIKPWLAKRPTSRKATPKGNWKRGCKPKAEAENAATTVEASS